MDRLTEQEPGQRYCVHKALLDVLAPSIIISTEEEEEEEDVGRGEARRR